MAFDISSVGQVYTNENLQFTLDEEHALIRFKMDTEITPEARFICRLVNPRTLLFCTILPLNIPEKHRQAVTEYITRVNYSLLLGNFQLDLSDGELSYKTVGVLEPEPGLPDEVIIRLTYVGFNMFDAYLPGVFAILYGGKSAAEAFADAELAADKAGG